MANKRSLDWPAINKVLKAHEGKTYAEIAKEMAKAGIKTSKNKAPNRTFVSNCMLYNLRRQESAQKLPVAPSAAPKLEAERVVNPVEKGAHPISILTSLVIGSPQLTKADKLRCLDMLL